MSDGNCNFLIATIITTGCFFLMFAASILALLHHFCFKNNYFSPLFLLLVFLHSLFRSIFLLSWIFTKDACLPLYYPLDDENMSLHFFATLPDAFLLSTVSLYMHTFASWLRNAFKARTGIVHFISMFQHIVNISVYFWYSLYYFVKEQPYQNHIREGLLWTTTICELINSLFLVFFTRIMRYHCFQIQENKYLLKIMSPASLLCFFGITIKIILLLAGTRNKNIQSWSLSIYFIIGEILPNATIALMQSITKRFQNEYLEYSFNIVSISPWSYLKNRLSTVTEEASIYSRNTNISQNSIQSTTHGSPVNLFSKNASRTLIEKADDWKDEWIHE